MAATCQEYIIIWEYHFILIVSSIVIQLANPGFDGITQIVRLVLGQEFL